MSLMSYSMGSYLYIFSTLTFYGLDYVCAFKKNDVLVIIIFITNCDD